MEPYGLDVESKELVSMLARGQWLPHEVTAIEHQIQNIKARIESGLYSTTAQYWTKRLAEVDPLLRMRWDAKNGWVIDRWINEWYCWSPIGVLGFHHIRLDLIDYLRSRDMQRFGPEAYLKQKREEAERVRKANDQRGSEKVLATVDSLSEKRVKEFIQVERAIQTGETIVARGESEKMLARMTSASEKAEQVPDNIVSENEAYHPRKLTRATGGEHI